MESGSAHGKTDLPGDLDIGLENIFGWLIIAMLLIYSFKFTSAFGHSRSSQQLMSSCFPAEKCRSFALGDWLPWRSTVAGVVDCVPGCH